MTRAEFDRWIGPNRPRLLRVARKVCGIYDAADAVQTAIERIYRTELYLRTRHNRNLVAFFSMPVRQAAWVARRARTSALRREREYTEEQWLLRAGSVPCECEQPHCVICNEVFDDCAFRDESGKRTSPKGRAE